LSRALNIASILLFCAGISSTFSVIISIHQLSNTDSLEGFGLTSQMVEAVKSFVICCVVIVAAAAIMSFLTAFTLRTDKRRFSLCLAGSAVAILGVGPYYSASILAVVALIMIAISGEEFK